MKEPVKLKSPSEIGDMVHNDKDAAINYIDMLHGLIKNYQIVIDSAITHNQNVH